MNKDLNRVLVEKILNHIPENYKAVDYLMDILGLSRDSVYRRLSFKKSFTINEIIKLSSDLRFSIDDAIEMINKGDSSNSSDHIDVSIIQTLDCFIDLMKKHIQAKNSEIIGITSHLSTLYIAKHENLFRFLYFKNLHQIREIPINSMFSDVIVPQKIIQKLREFAHLSQSVKNVSIIIDPDVYLNFIKDIQYFYYRKLISKEDLSIIKKELTNLIIEETGIMQKNEIDTGIKYNCYLSLLGLDSDTLYFRADEKENLFYGSCFINPLLITNSKACSFHRKWATSQKRYSILVTNANEDVLTRFISRQQERINNIDNYSLLQSI